MRKFPLSFSFTDMHLDRLSSQRKNNDWLFQQWESNTCCIIPIWKGQFLFNQSQLIEFNYLNKPDDLTKHTKALFAEHTIVFLGKDNSSPIFVIDVSHILEEHLSAFCQKSIELLDLRAALNVVDMNQASILGYAASLTYWHRANRFCGFCGSKTVALNGGHSLRCSNKACQKEAFPRTDPVVIMLVEYQPKQGPAQCLLAEHHRISGKVVSTLAGFVDPAETIEQAVIREVKEEAGVRVSDVEYITSQPWPFPHSLMFGFYAKATEATISIDDEEIRDARWFTADEIKAFGEWGDESTSYKLPRKESIARYLVDSWVSKQTS